MTNNSKISLVQWTKLILNFAIVVLLFLILLLQLAKQSKALEERQLWKAGLNRECCHNYTAPIWHNYFHITYTQKAFTAISLQTAWFGDCITALLFLNELLLMKIPKYFYLNKKRLKLKIFTWLHVDKIKSTLDLLDLVMCPGHHPNLHQDTSKEQALYLGFNKEKAQKPRSRDNWDCWVQCGTTETRGTLCISGPFGTLSVSNQSPSTS